MTACLKIYDDKKNVRIVQDTNCIFVVKKKWCDKTVRKYIIIDIEILRINHSMITKIKVEKKMFQNCNNTQLHRRGLDII